MKISKVKGKDLTPKKMLKKCRRLFRMESSAWCRPGLEPGARAVSAVVHGRVAPVGLAPIAGLRLATVRSSGNGNGSHLQNARRKPLRWTREWWKSPWGNYQNDREEKEYSRDHGHDRREHRTSKRGEKSVTRRRVCRRVVIHFLVLYLSNNAHSGILWLTPSISFYAYHQRNSSKVPCILCKTRPCHCSVVVVSAGK